MEARPKIRYFFVPALFGAIAVLGLRYGWYGLFLFFMLLAFIVIWWIMGESMARWKIETLQEAKLAAKEMKEMSTGQLYKLGVTVPFLDIDYSKYKPAELYGGVERQWFEKFLKESNKHSVWAYRDQKTVEDRNNWNLVIKKLVADGHVFANSAAGRHSYLWVSEWHKRLLACFVQRNLVNLNDERPHSC